MIVVRSKDDISYLIQYIKIHGLFIPKDVNLGDKEYTKLFEG